MGIVELLIQCKISQMLINCIVYVNGKFVYLPKDFVG